MGRLGRVVVPPARCPRVRGKYPSSASRTMLTTRLAGRARRRLSARGTAGSPATTGLVAAIDSRIFSQEHSSFTLHAHPDSGAGQPRGEHRPGGPCLLPTLHAVGYWLGYCEQPGDDRLSGCHRPLDLQPRAAWSTFRAPGQWCRGGRDTDQRRGEHRPAGPLLRAQHAVRHVPVEYLPDDARHAAGRSCMPSASSSRRRQPGGDGHRSGGHHLRHLQRRAVPVHVCAHPAAAPPKPRRRLAALRARRAAGSRAAA